MKTLELKLKKDVLIIEAPLDAYDISIGTHCIGVITNENVEKDTNGFYHIYKKGLFFGDIDMKLEFLCKGSELTEEIASELVEVDYSNFQSDDENYELKKNYIKDTFEFMSFEDSFISAIESKDFHWLENPIGEEPRSYSEVIEGVSPDELMENLKEWQEAEEKTFKNPLIFVKNYV